MSFFHQEKQSASPFSYPVPLSSYLFFSREYGGGSAQIHEHIAAFHPLDDSAYYFSLAFFEFAVYGFFFRFSYSLSSSRSSSVLSIDSSTTYLAWAKDIAPLSGLNLA